MKIKKTEFHMTEDQYKIMDDNLDGLIKMISSIREVFETMFQKKQPQLIFISILIRDICDTVEAIQDSHMEYANIITSTAENVSNLLKFNEELQIRCDEADADVKRLNEIIKKDALNEK